MRENTNNFLSKHFTPLIETTTDNIWVNKWPLNRKTIYTVYSVLPQGYNGDLFEVEPEDGFHFVDLWHHVLLSPQKENNKCLIETQIDAFNKNFLNTDGEGEVDCIVKLPLLIDANLNGDLLTIQTKNDGMNCTFGQAIHPMRKNHW